MKRLIIFFLLLVLAWTAVGCKSKNVVPTQTQTLEQKPVDDLVAFSTDDLKLAVNANGYVIELRAANKDILLGDVPFMVAFRDGKLMLPRVFEYVENPGNLVFDDGGEVRFSIYENVDYLKLEIIASGDYDALLLCPLGLKIDEVVGEVVGVVQGNGVAFGMQALNAKTNAGIPQEYADAVCEALDYQGKSVDVSVKTMPSYSLAATRMKKGVRMQFSVHDRSRVTHRRVQGVEGCMVLPVEGDDAGIEGASVALFACPKGDALNRIAAIELAENLPHPLVDGEWCKSNRAATKSCLVSDFSASDLDFILEKCQFSGLEYLCHSNAFGTLGHFKWNPDFVTGDDETVRILVEKAKSQGVKLGFRSFCNFISTDDAYVVPHFSDHLLKQGCLELQDDVTANQTDLAVYESSLFDKPMTMNVLQIGDELLTYRTTEVEGNIHLLHNCKRGAFGTKVSAHQKGERVYKLWDHPQGTFLADLSLQEAMSKRLAEIVNATGVSFFMFDGLEACAYSGHDDYAMARFATDCYSAWNHNVVNDANRLTHNNWHIHTHMNWGELTRRGQLETQVKNLDFYRRNLLPAMLGTFRLNLAERELECTSLEDVEWALSKAAGFDAGFGLSVPTIVMRNHGKINEIMNAVKNWETLRMAGVFSEGQKALLRDPYTEWHLEKVDEDLFQLYEMHISRRFRCMVNEDFHRAEWQWDNPSASRYALRLCVEGKGTIRNPEIRTSEGVLYFPCVVKAGQYLLYDYSGKAYITDSNYNYIESVVAQGVSLLSEGISTIALLCEKEGKDSPELSMRVMTRELNAEVRVAKSVDSGE